MRERQKYDGQHLADIAKRPTGVDWRALLNVSDTVFSVCGTCLARLNNLRKIARQRRARGDVLTPAQALVPDAAEKTYGWGGNRGKRRYTARLASLTSR